MNVNPIKIKAELDVDEVQTLTDLFQQEILVHTVESKLERKLNEISDEQLKWHLEYGEFLKQLRRKLLGKHTND